MPSSGMRLPASLGRLLRDWMGSSRRPGSACSLGALPSTADSSVPSGPTLAKAQGRMILFIFLKNLHTYYIDHFYAWHHECVVGHLIFLIFAIIPQSRVFI